MKNTILLSCGLALASLTVSLNPVQAQQVNRSKVLANPLNVNYLFDAPPDTAQTSWMSMSSSWADVLKPNPKALELDYTKSDPTWDEVKLARGDLARQLMDPKNRKAAVGITGIRTGADPVATYYKGTYYLFHSGAEGFWTSPDLIQWTHHKGNFPEGVAPTIMFYNDELYYITSRINHIYKTKTPLIEDSWVNVDTLISYKNDPKLTAEGAHDPHLYTENGKIYFYWESDYIMPVKVIELDPANHFQAKTDPIPVVQQNWQRFGWEVPGDRNDKYLLGGYQEGAIMTKHDGKYYLQYATSGTEFDSYADGLYVSDSPTGPFKPALTGPMSIRLGGFTTSAGHGDTFQDKYGNYWHLSTNIIGQRQMFERRISMYPVVFTPKGNMYTLTWFGDYPFQLPDKKVDFLKDDIHTGWMNLSLGKQVKASSEQQGYEAAKAADNTIKTWWAATTGKPGEYLQMDLGHVCTIQAIQPNFADHNCGYSTDMDHVYYQYVLEGSLDGKTWFMLADKSKNQTQNPHELITLEKSAQARYVRLTNKGQLPGQFSSYDLRIFGSGNGKAPADASFQKVTRPDSNKRRIQLSWQPVADAQGYLLRWGTDKDELYTSMEVYGDTQVDLGCFDRESTYYITIDTFNENGITRGKTVTTVK